MPQQHPLLVQQPGLPVAGLQQQQQVLQGVQQQQQQHLETAAGSTMSSGVLLKP
jgi:hypothetical protein